jgi:hypothetical protein
VIRNLINDAWLAFEDKVMPVASFKVDYKLDTMPTASIVPALGRSLTGGRRVTMGEFKEGDRADLFLKINGETKLLFSGFVSHIAGADNSADFTGQRTLSGTVLLHHRAVKLAGSPPVSFAYSGEHKDMFTTLNNRLARIQLFGTDPLAELDPISGFLALYISELGGELSSPPVAFKFIIEKLMSEFSPLMDVDDVVQAYEPAAMLENRPNPDFVNLIMHIANAFSNGWANSNTWETLKRACAQFFLHIVPYNNGFYIANPLALLQVPSKVIKTSEYVNIQQTTARNRIEPVDGVVVRIPSKIEPGLPGVISPVIYPPLEQASVMPTKKYYHFASVPPWLYPVLRDQFGARSSKPVNKHNRSTVEEGKQPAIENVPEHFEVVGAAVAKMIYSLLKMNKTAVSLTMPYRDDLMPGTAVQIENTDAEDLSFIGDTLHGMIYSTSIECSTLQAPGSIRTIVQVVSVRNTEDNTNLGLAEHPIYSHTWVGTDLCGNLLAEPPEVDFPSTKEDTAVVNPDATVVQPVDAGEVFRKAAIQLGGRTFDLDEAEIEASRPIVIGGESLIPITVPAPGGIGS